MAQQLIFDLIAELVGLIDFPEPIVEFGALQVEPNQPNDLRPLFPGRNFIGTDFRSGPGVDRIEDLRSLSFVDGQIGSSLCLDTLEHCENPFIACRELHRVVRDGGLCVISSVMLFPIHGYPDDYWRFTPSGFQALLAPFDDVWVTSVGHPQLPTVVIGVGAKGRRLGLSDANVSTVREAQASWQRSGEVSFPGIGTLLSAGM